MVHSACVSCFNGELVCGRVAAVEKAEAQKIQVVKAAEADAEAKFLQGQVRQPCSASSTEAISTERVGYESERL